MSSADAEAQSAPAFEPIADGRSACQVRLTLFEGPLDLLLHLIRENELEITDLPIAQVATQYLEYLDVLRELHLDETGEAEEIDSRAELIARLLEYQRFKEVAEQLGRRPLLGRDVFAPPGVELEPQAEGEREIEVGLLELVEALRRTLRQARASEAAHEVITETVTVRERMVAVIDALEQSELVELDALLREPDGRSSLSLVVATFLAILELARTAALRIYQSIDPSGAPRGPIRLRRAGADLAGAPASV